MNRATRKIRHYFNMVEVALALAVVGIGIAGIMSLFPVALNANRQAVGDNYAPDIANFFLSFIQTRCNQDSDWSATAAFAYSLPDSKPYTSSDDREIFSSTSLSGYENLYQASSIGSPKAPERGMYRIKVVANNITDFDAVVRIWRDNSSSDPFSTGTSVDCSIKDLYINGNTYEIPLKYGVAVRVEISWPREKPYDQRYKRDYYLEIFNPNI